MPEAGLNAEKSKLLREMENMDGGGDGYKARLNCLETIQKFEHQQAKLELDKKEVELKEQELQLRKQELDANTREPSWKERAIELLKVAVPSIVTGIFSFGLVRHMTRHEQDEGIYYGSKAMGFIKKP